MLDKEYELLYVIANKYTDEEVPLIVTKIDELLKGAGLNLSKTENLGKRKLAYPIKQSNHGFYILTEFKGASDMISKVTTQLSLVPEILRHAVSYKVETGVDKNRMARIDQERQAQAAQTVEYRAPAKPVITVAPGKKYIPDIEKELGLSSAKAEEPTTINEPPPQGDKPVKIEQLDEKLEEILGKL